MMYTGEDFDFRVLTSGFLRPVLREVYSNYWVIQMWSPQHTRVMVL